jgi:hypothetical protein
VNRLRSIVWLQEVDEVAKVLQEKNQQVFFGNQNQFLFMRKKDKGQSTRSLNNMRGEVSCFEILGEVSCFEILTKYTSKIFEIKEGQKSKNVAFEILK